MPVTTSAPLSGTYTYQPRVPPAQSSHLSDITLSSVLSARPTICVVS